MEPVDLTPADTATASRIRLPIFEGPLDLLLHLVKVDEIEITDISIAEITRQYIDHLRAMAEMNLEIAGDFLVMAATLMNIKLRTILPRPPEEMDRTNEEEIDEIMTTQDLVRKLVEYRRFKQIAAELREMEERQSGVFYRMSPVQVIPGSEQEIPRQDIRLLFDAFVSVLQQVRTRAEHHVLEEPFTVEDKLAELREVLQRDRRANLTRIFAVCVSKDEVICYFLAILEMAKMQEITLAQADIFEDILIEPWASAAEG